MSWLFPWPECDTYHPILLVATCWMDVDGWMDGISQPKSANTHLLPARPHSNNLFGQKVTLLEMFRRLALPELHRREMGRDAEDRAEN